MLLKPRWNHNIALLNPDAQCFHSLLPSAVTEYSSLGLVARCGLPQLGQFARLWARTSVGQSSPNTVTSTSASVSLLINDGLDIFFGVDELGEARARGASQQIRRFPMRRTCGVCSCKRTSYMAGPRTEEKQQR